MLNLRVFYHKKGRAKYISHLDVTRCMQRAIKRAGLPVWYTEGFNPHIYMTFALPLSLGYESESESMDFRLTVDAEREETAALLFTEVKEKLNAALPTDIRVIRVAHPKHKPEEIVSAVYTLTLTVPEGGEELEARFLVFMENGTIMVEKRSKKGVKLVDLRPDCQLLGHSPVPGGLSLVLRTAAGPTYNVNPTLLTEEFFHREGITEAGTQVLRKSVNLADGSEFE